MKFIFLLLFILIIGYYYWRFTNNNWQELVTTQNVEKYMRAVGDLQAKGIKYKTSTGGEEFNFRKNTMFSHTPPVSYTIYVRKEQFYKAQELLYELEK